MRFYVKFIKIANVLLNKARVLMLKLADLLLALARSHVSIVPKKLAKRKIRPDLRVINF